MEGEQKKALRHFFAPLLILLKKSSLLLFCKTYRNAFNKCPYKYVRTVAAMLKAIHTQEDRYGKQEGSILLIKSTKQMYFKEVAQFL